jgi:hypothetical protein
MCARVCLPIPFDLASYSDFQEAGALECHVCSFYAFLKNKMADSNGLGGGGDTSATYF